MSCKEIYLDKVKKMDKDADICKNAKLQIGEASFHIYKLFSPIFRCIFTIPFFWHLLNSHLSWH